MTKYRLVGDYPKRTGYPSGVLTDEQEAIKWATYLANIGYPVDVEVIEEESNLFDNITLY